MAEKGKLIVVIPWVLLEAVRSCILHDGYCSLQLYSMLGDKMMETGKRYGEVLLDAVKNPGSSGNSVSLTPEQEAIMAKVENVEVELPDNEKGREMLGMLDWAVCKAKGHILALEQRIQALKASL